MKHIPSQMVSPIDNQGHCSKETKHEYKQMPKTNEKRIYVLKHVASSEFLNIYTRQYAVCLIIPLRTRVTPG